MPLEIADKAIVVCGEISNSVYDSMCKLIDRVLKANGDIPFCFVLA